MIIGFLSTISSCALDELNGYIPEVLLTAHLACIFAVGSDAWMIAGMLVYFAKTFWPDILAI